MKAPISKILPNPDQPRTVFDETELEGLAQSVREHGVIQPIVVEPETDGYYILQDGERRLRAAKMAELTEIPITIAERTNHNGIERLARALVANVQRADMGLIDEAKAYQKLIEGYGDLQAVSEKTGFSIATVSLRLSLLELPGEVQRLFNLRRLPLNNKLLGQLKRLPKTQMIRIALRGGTRGLTARGFLNLINRELKGQKAYTPTKRVKPEPVLVNGHFNALSMVSKMDRLPADIRDAAVNTCKGCALYPDASPAMCRECPLPDSLRRLS